jgi:hypothetical protein
MNKQQASKVKMLRFLSSLNQVHSLDIYNKLEWDEEKLFNLHPVDLKIQIDLMAHEIKRFTTPYRKNIHKRKNERISLVKWSLMWSDIDNEFAVWSGHFNRILKRKIQSFGKEEKDEATRSLFVKYVYVYGYWWNTYHMINKIFKSKSRKELMKNKGNIEENRIFLSKIISGEINIKTIESHLIQTLDKYDSFIERKAKSE